MIDFFITEDIPQISRVVRSHGDLAFFDRPSLWSSSGRRAPPRRSSADGENNSLGMSEIHLGWPRKSMKIPGLPWFTMVYHGLPAQFQRVSCSFYHSFYHSKSWTMDEYGHFLWPLCSCKLASPPVHGHLGDVNWPFGEDVQQMFGSCSTHGMFGYSMWLHMPLALESSTKWCNMMLKMCILTVSWFKWTIWITSYRWRYGSKIG